MAIVNLIGTEFQVNTTPVTDVPSIATLANGNFVVTFHVGAGTPAGSDTRAQIFTPAGVPVGGEILVNPSIAGNQQDSHVVGLTDGGFAVLWVHADSGTATTLGAKLRLFDADGTPRTGEITIDATVEVTPTAICALDGGGLVAVWQDDGSNILTGRIYDANGATVGDTFPINSLAGPGQQIIGVVPQSGGGFLVEWGVEGPFVSYVSAQRFDASGSPVGPQIDVNSEDLVHAFSGVTALSDGRFVSLWHTPRSSGGNLFARIQNSDGSQVAGPFQVNLIEYDSTTSPAQAVALSDGHFVVIWDGKYSTGPDPIAYAVKGQLFDAEGARIGTEFLINSSIEGSQVRPDVSALPGSGFVVTWTDVDTTTYIGETKAQIFDFAGGGNTGDGGANIVLGTAANNDLAGAGGNDTIYGASGDDRLNGGAGDDESWAGDGQDRLESGSGIDELHGELGADRLFFYATLTAEDIADGGAGSDTLFLRGDYANLVFGATTVTGIEYIHLAPGFSYRLTTHDATVANGATLTVAASGLRAGYSLYFDGSAETGAGSRFVIDGGRGNDTIAGGAGRDVFHGGNGRDVLIGYAGNDSLAGGAHADRIELGGGGADTIVVDGARHSSSRHYDTIVAFDANADRFDLPITVTGIDTAIASGRLSEARLNDDLAAAANATRLAAGHAALFTPDRGAHAGEAFLIVDGNGIAGYQPLEDFVFRLEDATNLAGLTPADFI